MSQRSRARLVTLTLAAAAMFPSRSDAFEMAPSASAYLSWSFGPEGGFGLGVELSTMALLQGDWTCVNWGPMPVGVGPTVQLGLRSWHAPRLVIAAAGGANPAWQATNLFTGVQGELGVTIPLGEPGSFGLHTGGVVSGPLSHAFVRVDPAMDEGVAVGLGPRVPGPFNIPGGCIVGRPLRGADGATVRGRVRGRGPAGEQAAAWAEDARQECEAIAAFLGLATELLALGASEALVEAALDAAAEEMRHAAGAARLAARSGAEVWPVLPALPARPAPTRAAALARLAVESWIDGALGEGAAADEAQLAAAGARDPLAGAHQSAVAVEERGHARLGRAVAAWALREGGEEVRAALQATRQMAPALPEAHADLPDRAGWRERVELRVRRAEAATRDLGDLLR